jgi:hypothetical protein
MDFAATTTKARAKVKQVGAPVSFDPPPTSSEAAVAGYATEEEGDPDMYVGLGLTESDIVTLFFVRDTYAVLPSLLDRSVTWAGKTYLVKNVRPYSPAGSCIYARVVIAR